VAERLPVRVNFEQNSLPKAIFQMFWPAIAYFSIKIGPKKASF
jgi:hypothetical protein